MPGPFGGFQGGGEPFQGNAGVNRFAYQQGTIPIPPPSGVNIHSWFVRWIGVMTKGAGSPSEVGGENESQGGG
jgi:hypothetical protein